MKIKLSVIILNYKDEKLTKKCVDYLIKAIDKAHITTEIIIIDNSGQETYTKLKRTLNYKNVKIINSNTNLGFARANNIGIKKAKGQYILLLNNDAFVTKHTTIEKGIQYLQDNKDTAVWSPQIKGRDGKVQNTYSKFPSILEIVNEYFFFNRLHRHKTDTSQIKEVDMVIGAFFLMNKKIIKEVGLLDEDYFFQVEDVDYCKRIKNKGYKIVYDTTETVIHIGGASQHDKWVNAPYLHKNRILYFKKHGNRLQYYMAKVLINLGLIYTKILLRIIKNEKSGE